MAIDTMDYLTIALPKGKLFSLSADLFARIGYTAEGLSEKSRKLVITNEEKRIKFIITKTASGRPRRAPVLKAFALACESSSSTLLQRTTAPSGKVTS